MSEGAAGREGGRPLAWLRRIDDASYQAERSVVVTFLITIAITMFLDVVHGRLVARDSKVGKIIAKLSGISDMETRAWIDQSVAPWVGLVLGLALLWFGFWTAERHKKGPVLPIKHSPLVATVLSALGIAGVCWLMLTLPSWLFYLLGYGVCMAFYVAYLVRNKPEHWKVRAGAMVLGVTPVFYYLARYWIPRGFTWSQELSLMMLLWIGFLGASVCAHEGKHLRMEAFDKILPPGIRRWITAVGFIAAAAFSLFLAYLGYDYVTGPAAATESAQMGISDRLSIVSVPIAFAITTLRFIAAALSAALGGEYGRHQPEVDLSQAKLDAEPEAEA